jgi:hypothetical protein
MYQHSAVGVHGYGGVQGGRHSFVCLSAAGGK